MADNRKHRSLDFAEKDGKRTFSGLKDVQVYGRTDVVYQEVQLYIEGVQIPFEAVSISSSYNELPEASITIPHFSGLQEICKGYFPKVHIFYKDLTFERFLLNRGVTPNPKDLQRVLFSGVLVGCQYGKNRSIQSDTAFISFRCMHKYYVLKEVILKFGGRGIESFLEGEQGATAKAVEMNSTHAMVLAISGVKKPEDSDTPVTRDKKGEGEVNHLQEDLKAYYDRLKGIPGIGLALWNIFKRDSYRFEDYAKAMTEMYIPIVDSNLRFFKRMRGHGAIESSVESDRMNVDSSELVKKYSDYRTNDKEVKILVPPAYKNFLGDAVAIDMAVLLAGKGIGYSGEMADFITILKTFLRSIRYDMEVLASPIQSINRDMESVDVLVKPLLPFYFAPVCNVLLPHMFSTVSLNDFSYATPTRAITQSSAYANGSGPKVRDLEYRSPHEVRVSTTYNNPNGTKNLAASRIQGGEYPAPHEFGRGIKVKPLQIESWVNYLFSSKDASSSGGESNTGWSQDDTNLYSGKVNTTYGKKTASYEESNRQIFPDISPLEDVKNEKRVWKYWDKTKAIPYYYGNVDIKGFNMVAGTAGTAPEPFNTNIENFRRSMGVPLFWNVVYFPSNNSYLAFPPHYDYVGNSWWRRRSMDAEMARVRGKYNDKEPGQIEKYWNASTGRPTPPKQQEKKEEAKAAAAETKGSAAQIQSQEDAVGVPSNLKNLVEYWNKRYPGFEEMNPFESGTTTGIYPYEVSLFNLVDYDYSISLVENRVGQVSGPFNPFIVPGYPMDIIEASPERPSIHAFCTSVTHSITSSSISTDISFVSALTYDELRAYELPSILPWFVDKLGMLSKMSLIDQTPQAKEQANKYYIETLGCGFADPSILEDADTGGANSVLIASNGDFKENGSNIFMNSSSKMTVSQMMAKMVDPNYSWEGNMCLVRREIETMSDIEAFSGITFIGVQSRSSLSQTENFVISPLHREVKQRAGRSIFLDYTKEDEVFQKLSKAASGTPEPKKSK